MAATLNPELNNTPHYSLAPITHDEIYNNSAYAGIIAEFTIPEVPDQTFKCRIELSPGDPTISFVSNHSLLIKNNDRKHLISLRKGERVYLSKAKVHLFDPEFKTDDLSTYFFMYAKEVHIRLFIPCSAFRIQ
jgi:hypothetical protein